jgi:carboxylesterase
MVTERFPVMPGAEAWSASGHGDRARVSLLIVHGFTGNPCSMRPLGEALASRGFGVEVIRLPGHGTDWRDMRSTRYADWRAHAEQALLNLAGRGGRVLLVGLSMGATLALDLGSAHSARVAGVVSINAAVLNREGVAAKLGPYLAKILPVVPAAAAGIAKNDIAKPGQVENAYPWVPLAAGNSLIDALPDVRRAIEKLRIPVLVAYSLEDHSVPTDNSRAILKMLEGRDVTELVLARSYHVATLDYDFELLVERISEFADRVGQPQAPLDRQR